MLNVITSRLEHDQCYQFPIFPSEHGQCYHFHIRTCFILLFSVSDSEHTCNCPMLSLPIIKKIHSLKLNMLSYYLFELVLTDKVMTEQSVSFSDTAPM